METHSKLSLNFSAGAEKIFLLRQITSANKLKSNSKYRVNHALLTLFSADQALAL